ncbi:MAG: radical SAM protein [Candidatus Micrarchaeia archaeon]|jgi:MoaA/NifB/PqqE/SkfB family radical SAM enzyme
MAQLAKAKSAIISANDGCPNNCIICYNAANRQLSRVLPFDKFKKIIESCPNLEIAHIEGGEPFRHRQLVAMMNLLSARGIRGEISTSATIWRDDVVDAVRQSNGLFSLQLHIPAASREAYESFTGNDAFLVSQKIIGRLVAEIGAPQVKGRMTVCRENLGELSGVMEIAKRLGIALDIGLFLPARGSSATMIGRSEIESVAFAVKAYFSSGLNVSFTDVKEGRMGCPVAAAAYGYSLSAGACSAKLGEQAYFDAGGNASGCAFLGMV